MTDERPLSTSDLARVSDEPPAIQSHEEAPVRAAVAERPVERRDAPAASLFPEEEERGFRTRWDAIQTGFVDEPRKAVEQADALVAQVMKRLAEVFADERSGLERQWDRGESVSTEDLRVALTRYRAFFSRLLSI
jgi:hypothetical protein